MMDLMCENALGPYTGTVCLYDSFRSDTPEKVEILLHGFLWYYLFKDTHFGLIVTIFYL